MLNPSSDGVTPAIIILDYGRDVERYAIFQISHMSGDTQTSRLLPADAGLLYPECKIQQPPRTKDVQANTTGLIGYSFNLLSAMAKLYEQTGDEVFLHRWAPKAVRMLDWAYSQTLPNHLLNITDPGLGGGWDYSDPTSSGIVTQFNILYAYSLKKWISYLSQANINATMYQRRLNNLQKAINDHLWSEELQAYYHSEAYQDFFSQDANALAILSDTTHLTGNRTAALLSTMAQQLYIPKGALAFSNANIASGFAQQISPYTSGYHLKAAFHANDAVNAKRLLHSIWGPMSDPRHANYTGCMWEVMSPDGTPGLGSLTSLCHAWSAGPTADLSHYVLIISPSPLALRSGKSHLRLWVWPGHGENILPPHGNIMVDWSFNCSGHFNIAVSTPVGTRCTVALPSSLNRTLEVQDGKVFRYKQHT